MAKSKKWLHLEEYQKIKSLLNAGIGNKQVANVMSRSEATVSFVKTSKDFADYKFVTRTMIEKSKKNVARKAQESAPERRDIIITSEQEFYKLILNRLDTIVKIMRGDHPTRDEVTKEGTTQPNGLVQFKADF